MSKLTRVWRKHVEPMLDRMLRRGDPQLAPRGVVTLDVSSQTLLDRGTVADSAIRYPLAAATAWCPRTFSGNLRCFDELLAKGLTPSGQDRWWQELLCSDDASCSAIVACIYGGRVLHRDGAIIDRGNRLVLGISGLDFDSEVPGNPLRRKQLSSPVHVPGTLALLTGFASHNYYHWLIDIVPKLTELQGVGIPIDHYFIPQDYAFQRATVKALGIDPKKIVSAKRTSHITADRILAVTWQGQSVTPSRVQSIRQGFTTVRQTVPEKRPRRIYISRNVSRVRRIINERQLFSMLRSYDFEFLCLERMSMMDQIDAFQTAEIVVAPHGAGLANLSYCRPGTKVLEITTPFRVLSLFTRLANAADLNFHLHLAHPCGKTRLNGETAVGDSNMRVDVSELERALQPLIATLLVLLWNVVS